MWWISVIVFILCVNSGLCLRYSNNVCRTLVDYKTIYHNKNCWYNPDVGSSPLLIAKRYGYPFEKHSVITKDGYILTLHRIPTSRNATDSGKRQPIMIHHGLAGSSAFWVLQGKKSIAFFLADNGFDVWLANSRGTYYSPKHEYLTMDSPEYWNFGFHEIAIYDLPASIDYIANKTSEKGNLIYVGHSMGTTISYIYSIVEKQHAEDNLKGIISLAPVAHMKYVRGTFKLLASQARLLMDLATSLKINAVGQFFELQRSILSATCSKYPLIYLCNSILILSSGLSDEQFQPEILPVFFSFYPSAISTKTLIHFSQLINNHGRFEQYDYGPEKNIQVYNSMKPPEYNVSKISLPIYLFVGKDDIVGNLKDAQILEQELNEAESTNQSSIYLFPFAHNDFFMGKNLKPFHESLLKVITTKLN